MNQDNTICLNCHGSGRQHLNDEWDMCFDCNGTGCKSEPIDEVGHFTKADVQSVTLPEQVRGKIEYHSTPESEPTRDSRQYENEQRMKFFGDKPVPYPTPVTDLEKIFLSAGLDPKEDETAAQMIGQIEDLITERVIAELQTVYKKSPSGVEAAISNNQSHREYIVNRIAQLKEAK